MDKSIRKNILDLRYQKNLTIASTTVIVFFTYLIGVVLWFLTKQIKFDFFSIVFLFLFPIPVTWTCALFFYRALEQIGGIPKALETMD